jgi:hypothetical protein
MLVLAGEDEPVPAPVFKGAGDFDTGVFRYTFLIGYTPCQEIFDIGSAISYQRNVDDPMWTRKEYEDSLRDLAIVSLRNQLGASSGALEYLRSVTVEMARGRRGDRAGDRHEALPSSGRPGTVGGARW